MHVSFRNRLTFFFILLVILPMLAVATVGILIVRNTEERNTDERLALARTAAQALYQSGRDSAEAVARTFAQDDSVAAAIRAGDRRRLQRRVDDLIEAETAARVRLSVDGEEPIDEGDVDAIAPARSRINADGRDVGMIELSTTRADEYATLLRRITEFQVVISEGKDILAGTLEPGSADRIPTEGDVELDGTGYRVTTFRTPAFDGGDLVVRALLPDSEIDDAVLESTLGIGFILIAFLICAFAFALTAARSLQAQIDRLLSAARALGKGDFSVEVPAEGTDDFSELGREFNSMARQLEARLEELQLERSRLQETVKRVGESLGKGLDRDALLGIVVQTAVDGVGAEGGRVVMRSSANGAQPQEAARAGNVSSYLAAMTAAETAALANGAPAETQISGANALARPLPAPEPDKGMVGVISIARPGGAFTERQQELFAYLARQAAISIENVGLHETIQRQAGLGGAFEFAGRFRPPIEALELPLVECDGILLVTASFGVAALPHSAK